MSVQHMSSANSAVLGQMDIPDSPVGFLCRDVPLWVSNPPIESVVFAWGASEDHQLGLDTEQDIYSPKVVESLLGIRFMGRSFGCCPLVGGSRNTLAIDADGGLWSWGWNDRGTLGHGHRALQRKPAPVEGLAGVEVVQAAIGGWHCLALDAEGQVYCWGGNEYQQCGLVAPGDEAAAAAAAAAAAGGSGSNGGQQQQEEGGKRWQRSSSSGVGGVGGVHGVLPTARDVLVPLRCMPGLVVKQVACGGMNSVVLTDAGEVWTWGEPWGEFAMDIQRAPKKVPGAVNIAAIACGAFHNLALVADGSVLSWGTNDYGQLGNGSTIYSMTPVEVCDLEDVAVADIAAGGWHSMALTADGQIYVWGRGEYGRLGISDRTGSSKLRPHKVRGLEEQVVVQVAAGGTHSLCVTSGGRMFIWGRASYGRLGLGRDARDAYAPVEVQLPGGHQRWKIAAATAGGRHTMCLAVPVRDGGFLKGSSIYGGNSEGINSRAASVVNEPINNNSSSSTRGTAAAAANGSTSAAVNGTTAAAPGNQNSSQQQHDQQQQQQGRMYDPFAAQQQQQQGSSSGRGSSQAPEIGGKPGQPGGSSSGGNVAVAGGVSSPYQPGAPLPHGPALSMQSSYSLVTSPGSSILGGGSPPAVLPAVAAGGPLGSGAPWGIKPSGSSTSSTAAAAAAAAAVGGGSSSSAAAAAPEGPPAGSPAAATARATAATARSVLGSGAEQGLGFGSSSSPPRSPRSGRSTAAGTPPGSAAFIAAAAGGGGSGSGGGAGGLSVSPRPSSLHMAAMAAMPGLAAAGGSSGGSNGGTGGSNGEPQPCGVEAVHAATEAAVQQMSALRVHLHDRGLLPGGAVGGGGGLQQLLTSHGPLAAAAAAAGGGSLQAGQGSSVSPRGIPPPMSPSQRAVGMDPGSSLREFWTGDQYEVTGRGDSLEWQHQAVALELQEGELLVEDDAMQQELQDEQQREADEAALEEAEERREEQVRLRRQEQQQQLREAQLRQQQQQQQSGSGPGSSQHGMGSYGLGVFLGAGSGGSSGGGGRPGSSHGRSSGFAAATGGSSGSNALSQQMRRSHSHQSLSDPLAAVAAMSPRGAGEQQQLPQGLQRYGSSPQTGLVIGSAGSGGVVSSGSRQQQQQQLGGLAGGGGSMGGMRPARVQSGGLGMPSFSAGMGSAAAGGGGGVRRMTSGGIMTSGPSRPGVGRVDSDASQEGLLGLDGGSPNDSPRQSTGQGDDPASGRESVADGGLGGPGRRGGGREGGSASSLSRDSSSSHLGASPPSSGRYDVGLGQRYIGAVSNMSGREQLHLSTHLS